MIPALIYPAKSWDYLSPTKNQAVIGRGSQPGQLEKSAAELVVVVVTAIVIWEGEGSQAGEQLEFYRPKKEYSS